MPVLEGTGGGEASRYAPAINWLRQQLGPLYYEEPDDQRDQVIFNMARLQASTGIRGGIDELQERLPSDLEREYLSLFNVRGIKGDETLNYGGSTITYGDLVLQAQESIDDQSGDLWGEINKNLRKMAGEESSPVETITPSGDTSLTFDDIDRDASGDTATDATGGTGGAGSGGGGGTGVGTPSVDTTLSPAGTPRQIPEGAQLWRIDGSAVKLAYQPPGADFWLTWHVEDPDRLQAIYGDNVPEFREMTGQEYQALSPWENGLSAELEAMDDPWQQFMSDYEQAAEIRPWLKDPSMLAVMAGAYLEGRAPTSDELAQTDWWNNHSADERAWLETSVTAGREEVERLRDDAIRAVDESLRQAGVNNAPERLVRHIAEMRLTGQWSDTYTSEQIRKLADPFASGELDDSVNEVLAGSELDQTRQQEDRVRALMTRWLGPDMGRFDESNVREWAGRLRNDPDGEVELVEMLRQQRLALLPGYTNENLTYEDIVQPVRNLASNVWGQPVGDESFLVDLANTMDYTEMAKRLRKRGIDQGVQKVVRDSLEGLGSTSLGNRVVRSAV